MERETVQEEEDNTKDGPTGFIKELIKVTGPTSVTS